MLSAPFSRSRARSPKEDGRPRSASVSVCGAGVASWRRWKREREAIEGLRLAQRRYESLSKIELNIEGLRPPRMKSIRFREGNALLDALERACRLLGMQEADRSYRSEFTANYRALFAKGKQKWLYRVDVLHAAQDEIGAIWVNGERYVFPEEVLSAGSQLSKQWELLTKWLSNSSRTQNLVTAEFVQIMTELDVRWVRFEEAYVKRLIFIESQAKRLIVEAVQLEEKLASGSSDPENRRNLVDAINRLNAIGNIDGKGRTDLPVDILDFVENETDKYPELRCLTVEIRRSFQLICKYLRSISASLDVVEPHIANNTELVNLLFAWEESWEIGKKYLVDKSLRMGLVSFLRHVNAVCFLDGMGTFKEQLQTYDAEALWALAKIAILQFLSSPHSDLLCREFLPECWENDDLLEVLAVNYQSLPDDAYHHLCS